MCDMLGSKPKPVTLIGAPPVAGVCTGETPVDTAANTNGLRAATVPPAVYTSSESPCSTLNVTDPSAEKLVPQDGVMHVKRLGETATAFTDSSSAPLTNLHV